MNGDTFVDRLVADLRPLPRRLPLRWLFAGVAGGMVVAAIVMTSWLGLRPDLAAATATLPFWMKFAFTLALAAAAFAALHALARPGGSAGGAAWSLALVMAAAILLAAAELALAPDGERTRLVMGSTALVCPLNIAMLSLPILAGLLWAMRRLAPTSPVLAGAAMGLAAGAAGAWVYAFHCDESAAAFVVLWYDAGIAAAVVLGAVAGRFLLRW